MVRVISEKLFSPPRSRHSSGETVDKELAARAVEVLSGLNSRRFEFSDYESSSDSHWDSEVDVEGDGHEILTSKDLSGAEGNSGGTDVLRKRKERRRERNKLSAQAYRVRRKEQSVKQQNVLVALQEQNVRLKNMVDSLEEELTKVRHSLRHRLPAASTATLTTPAAITKQASDTTSASASPVPPFSFKPSDKEPLSFSQLAKEATSPQHQQPMDNDQSCRQQISPVVDNFLFSKPLSTASPTNCAMSPPKPPFSFPASPAVGARHTVGTTSFLTSTLPTISEKPDMQFGNLGCHQHQQSSDLNANARTKAASNNGNMINANTNMFGMCRNNNLINNNNFLAMPVIGEAGVHSDLHSPVAAFKFSED